MIAAYLGEQREPDAPPEAPA
ncbi:MAG: hypothetical protein ACXWA9_04885 [Acidimicrobiia bacterium]